MATRSMISIVRNDGTVQAVYSHWDGYPAYVGAILHKFYNEPKLIHQLLDRGDISCLGETFEATEFQRLAEFTAPGEIRYVESLSMQFLDINEACDYYEGSWCEWFYKHEDGIWWARSRDTDWRSLAGILEDIREETSGS